MNADMIASLDWDRWYGDHDSWPNSKKVFLASAVCQLGEKLVPFFSPMTMAYANLPVFPTLPSPYEAFEEDEVTPIPIVHKTYGDDVLELYSIADYSSHRLKELDDVEWANSFVHDEITGERIFDPRKYYTQTGEISFDHWLRARAESTINNDRREAAHFAVPHLARAIAKLALNDDITVLARRIGGVRFEKLKSEIWEIDDATHRIASCAINMDDPASVTADPTHHLFLDPTHLDVNLHVYAERFPVVTPEGYTAKSLGALGERPPKGNAALIARIARIIRRHLVENPDARNTPAFLAAVMPYEGKVHPSIIDKACKLLEADLGKVRKKGRPIGAMTRG